MKKKKKIYAGAARERQERPYASRNNEKDRRGLGKTFIKLENRNLVFLVAHPIVDPEGSIVDGERPYLSFISHTPDHNKQKRSCILKSTKEEGASFRGMYERQHHTSAAER